MTSLGHAGNAMPEVLMVTDGFPLEACASLMVLGTSCHLNRGLVRALNLIQKDWEVKTKLYYKLRAASV